MAVTVETLTLDTLTAQPYTYDAADIRSGLIARAWAVEGLARPADWLSLVGIFETWRAARINDPDTLASASIGTTVSFSGLSLGIAWSNVACWFDAPPTAEVVGAYVRISFSLVDASEALAVLLRQEEKSLQNAEATIPDFGTLTFSRASGTSPVVKLTKPLGARRDGPDVGMTATGVSYVTGPLAAHKIQDIEGYLTTGTYEDLLNWYDETIAGVPSATSWFPVSAPAATAAEVVVTGGVKVTRHKVQVTALQIL